MKQIVKNKEPKSLTEHRANNGTFDNLKKDELRDALLVEQGNICCYCMRRIPQKLSDSEKQKNYPSTKIEHLQSQSQHPDKQLVTKICCSLVTEITVYPNMYKLAIHTKEKEVYHLVLPTKIETLNPR